MKKFILKSKLQLDNAINYIKTLACDGKLEVVIREHKDTRSLAQNAYYWRLLAQISEQTIMGNRQFTPDCWHEYLKQKVMPIEFVDKSGKTVTKYKMLPDGSTMIRSTRELSVAEFADYITSVGAYAMVELEVKFAADYQEVK